MLITQQVSSVPACTITFQDAGLISESLGWVREDAADAGLVPMAPGIPHPAQVPARTCSSQHFPGAALPTTAFAQSRVIYPSANSAGTGIVWVSERPEMGLRCWFFVAGVLNMSRSSHGCSGAAQRAAGCWIKAQSLLLRKRSFPAGLLLNCYKSKLSGPHSGNFFFLKKKAVSYVFLLTKAWRFLYMLYFLSPLKRSLDKSSFAAG